MDSITDSMDNESEQALGDTEGQGSLACCSPWGGKELDMTKQLITETYCIAQGIYSISCDNHNGKEYEK